MGGAYITIGGKRKAYSLLVRKRPLGRPRVDNIMMDIGEKGWCRLDWSGSG
jgi:hypothetical protein